MSNNSSEEVRHYNFSDGTLEQFADFVKANITRDLTPLASRGITAATATNLQGLRDDFAELPTYTEALGIITTAVEEKNEARETALIDARRLRTAAQNVFGEVSGKYNRFGFTGMDKIEDNDLPRAMRRMQRTGVNLQSAIAAEGIDASFLSRFTDNIKAFDDKLEDVRIAEEARDIAAEDRIKAGNILFKEIVRLCNIGKDVFAPTSEAKYNDYVMVHFTGTDEGDIDDYEIETTIVPAGSSLLLPIGTGGIPPNLNLYLRAVNGSVIICTTNLPASPCASGYELLQDVTFKDAATALGLDLSKTNFQITNPGLTPVTVRAGSKITE
jgi:hypothetical protein